MKRVNLPCNLPNQFEIATIFNSSSKVPCRFNKITKRRIILSAIKKCSRIIFYPTLNLSNAKNNLFQRIKSKKKKKKTGNIKTTAFKLNYFSSLQSKKFSRLKGLSETFFQFYAINKNQKMSHHSVGNIIELCNNGTSKLVFLTVLDPDVLKESILYCSDRMDDNFLNFYDELSRTNNKSMIENFFNQRKRAFRLHLLKFNRESHQKLLGNFKNSEFLSQRDLSFLNYLHILEVPLDITKNIDYDNITRINLNSSIDYSFVRSFNETGDSSDPHSTLDSNFHKKIFFFSQNFPLDNTLNFAFDVGKLKNQNYNRYIINSNSSLNETKYVNSGELNVNYGLGFSPGDMICKFEATCLTNGVGNLIYKAEGKFKPLGINIGTASNCYNRKLENVYISLENKTTLSFLRLYLIENTCESFTFMID